MISFLRGTVCSKQLKDGPANRLVIDVSGVGFELTVSRQTLASIGQIGDRITVHTQLSIRENDWTMFGFALQEEADMFALLQSVNGVGPKMALALVGTLAPNELANAIVADDHKLLSQAPGVGNKLAQRLCLELKSKIESWQAEHGTSFAPGAQASVNAAFDEVKSILAGLGYTPTEISQAIKKAQDASVEKDVEQLVRYSLKVLGTAAQ